MKKIFTFLLLSKTLLYSQYQPDLKLKDAIDTALKNNIQILQTEQELITAKQKLRQARLMFLPQIYFTGDIIKANLETPSIIGTEPNYRYLDSYRNKNIYGIKTSLIQPLYTGGILQGNLKMAKAEYNREKLKNESAKSQTLCRTKKIFYSAVFYKNLLDELESNYQKIKDILNKKTPQMLNLEIDIKNEINELKNRYLISKAELNMEMGAPPGFDFDISQKLEPFKEGKIDLNKSIITAMEKRPELKIELYQLEIGDISTHIASLRKYPSLYLGVSYDIFSDDYSSLWSSSLRNENWTAYITIHYPFPYDLWINITKRKAEQRNCELKKIELEEKIKFNITKAYREYILYTEKIKTYTENLNYADNLFKSALLSKQDEKIIEAFKFYYKLKKEFLTAIYGQINSLIELEKEQAEEIIN